MTTGNFPARTGDYPDMLCETVRGALSASLDAEEPGLAESAVDAHLAECRPCRIWLVRAERVTRAVRLQPAPDVPDLTSTIMAAVAADRAGTLPAARPSERGAAGRSAAGRGAAGRGAASARKAILRVAVAVTALVQLLLAVAELVSGTGVVPDLHTSRELACFDAALAVGFLLAAWRPALARPYTPIAIALAVFLALTSGVDIAHGGTTAHGESAHLATVGQAVLLWALARTTVPRGQRRPVAV